MSGGTFAFFRFSVILLLGNLALTARSNSLLVSKHAAELLGPQFSSNIYRGERAMYIGLMFCFWYNIVAWALAILDSCVLLVYIGLIDLGVAAALIPAVYWQSTYIPHRKGACQSATSWQMPNSSEESWFTVLAKLQKPADPDPKGCCEKYLENWTFTIVVMWSYILGFWNFKHSFWCPKPFIHLVWTEETVEHGSDTEQNFLAYNSQNEGKVVLPVSLLCKGDIQAQRTPLTIDGKISPGQPAIREQYHLPGQTFGSPISAADARHLNIGRLQPALYRHSKSQFDLEPYPGNSLPNWEHQTPHGAFSTEQL
ncbi:hypothetical protein VF21_09699 [Pseudogymnoascus sp. 05NY08]|nr:hypothetical protein VF21_09699 [Pseudogymnoascus sp. 05NY08]